MLTALAVVAAGCSRDRPPNVAEPYQWQTTTVPLTTGGAAAVAFAYARERPRPPGCDRVGDQCERIAGRARMGDSWTTRQRRGHQIRNMLPGTLMIACASDADEDSWNAELALSPSVPVLATSGWHPHNWERLDYEYLHDASEWHTDASAVTLSLTRDDYTVEDAAAVARPGSADSTREFLTTLGDPLSYGPDSALRVRAWTPRSASGGDADADALLWEFGMGEDSDAAHAIPAALAKCGLSQPWEIVDPPDSRTADSSQDSADSQDSRTAVSQDSADPQDSRTADRFQASRAMWQLIRAPLDLAPGEVRGVMTAAFGYGKSLTGNDLCDDPACPEASVRHQTPMRLQVVCRDINDNHSGLLSVAFVPPYAVLTDPAIHSAMWKTGTVWLEAEGVDGREVSWGDGPPIDGHVRAFTGGSGGSDALHSDGRPLEDGNASLMLKALEDFAGRPESVALLTITVTAGPGEWNTPPPLVWEFDLSDPSADSSIGAVVQHCGRWW